MHIKYVRKILAIITHLQGQQEEFLHGGKWRGSDISPEFLECLLEALIRAAIGNSHGGNKGNHLKMLPSNQERWAVLQPVSGDCRSRSRSAQMLGA